MPIHSSGGLSQAFCEMGSNINTTIDQARAQIQAQARRIQQLVAEIEQEEGGAIADECLYILKKKELEEKIDQDVVANQQLQSRIQMTQQQVAAAEQGYNQVMSSFRSHTHPGARVQNQNGR
jgi:hypothetical protein